MQDPPASSTWSLPEWPAFGLQSDVRPALRRAADAGRPVVLGTLYAHEGAAPLGEGAQILFDAEGSGVWAAAGFLSGGCVEGDIALHAQAVLEGGEPRRLVYGRGGPPDIRLLCGSRIEVMLERIGPDEPALERLLELEAARRPALWLSDGGIRACLAEDEAPANLPAALRPVLAKACERPAVSGPVGAAIFRRHAPRFRLVVVGGDPTTLAIARLAVEAGFETTLVRPKGPSTPPPAPGAQYFRGEPAEAFRALGLDPWTAVAVATHDIDIDHDALRVALPSAAGYVGALGSRKRIPERLTRLTMDGVPEAAVARLKAPIGLDIGARAPWEIAVSVIAETIQALKALDAARAWPAAASAAA
ncbi:MAG TPA: XdhC family protein [Caulobacteraceae bacterium]